MKLKHFLVVAFAFVAGMASAQQMPAIPIDPNVRIGKLDNGLTYYIRHNNWPENVANFYIAQRVGSIQEEESQRGLAHFLEHMAFNGSEHFPDSTLLEYTRSWVWSLVATSMPTRVSTRPFTASATFRRSARRPSTPAS